MESTVSSMIEVIIMIVHNRNNNNYNNNHIYRQILLSIHLKAAHKIFI